MANFKDTIVNGKRSFVGISYRHLSNRFETLFFVQNKILTAIRDQLMIRLVDWWQGSSTAWVNRKVIVTGEQPVQLYISFGIAHRYKAELEGAILLYAMDQQFNLADLKEGQLAWDFFGAKLCLENQGQ